MAEVNESAAWIRIEDEGQWSGELRELLDGARDPLSGEVDNVLRVHSLSAASLRAHLHLYRVAMGGTRGLPKVDREMVALVVSKLNGCHY